MLPAAPATQAHPATTLSPRLKGGQCTGVQEFMKNGYSLEVITVPLYPALQVQDWRILLPNEFGGHGGGGQKEWRNVVAMVTYADAREAPVVPRPEGILFNE